jgi:hypothetical protein
MSAGLFRHPLIRYICSIHVRHHFGGRDVFPIYPLRIIHVIMNVNDWKFRPGQLLHHQMHHRMGLEILYQQRHPLGCIRIFFVRDVRPMLTEAIPTISKRDVIAKYLMLIFTPGLHQYAGKAATRGIIVPSKITKRNKE